MSNYFYKGTVEEQIYQGISDDYDWFTDIVGPAQPVLGQVESAFEGVAMQSPGADRDAMVANSVQAIRVAIEEAKSRSVTLSDLGGIPGIGAARQPAIDLPGLERILLSAQATAQFFRPHPLVAGAYFLDLPSAKAPVTFRRAVLDEHAPDIALLTYGTPLLDELFHRAGVAASELPRSDSGERVHSLEELEQLLARRLVVDE